MDCVPLLIVSPSSYWMLQVVTVSSWICMQLMSQSVRKSNLVGVPVKIVLQYLVHHDSDSNHLVLQFDRMDCVRLLIMSPALYSMLQWWQCPPECLCSSCQLSAAWDEDKFIESSSRVYIQIAFVTSFQCSSQMWEIKNIERKECFDCYLLENLSVRIVLISLIHDDMENLNSVEVVHHPPGLLIPPGVVCVCVAYIINWVLDVTVVMLSSCWIAVWVWYLQVSANISWIFRVKTFLLTATRGPEWFVGH